MNELFISGILIFYKNIRKSLMMSINKITIKKIFDENKDILSDDIKDGEGKITDYPPNTECNREYFAELFEGLREAKEYEDGKAEAEQELADAIEEGETELADAWTELNDGSRELQDGIEE